MVEVVNGNTKTVNPATDHTEYSEPVDCPVDCVISDWNDMKTVESCPAPHENIQKKQKQERTITPRQHG